MNNVVLSTGGDWPSTMLTNNGMEWAAEVFFVELHAGRDEFGDPERGGVGLGGEMTAVVRPADSPHQEIGIFPGRLEMNFPGHTIVIENSHPMFAFEFTRVWYNGQDVSDEVMDIYVEFDYPQNNVKAFIVLYKSKWFRSDEVATINIL
jgi:hypothetical protein